MKEEDEEEGKAPLWNNLETALILLMFTAIAAAVLAVCAMATVGAAQWLMSVLFAGLAIGALCAVTVALLGLLWK